KGARPRLRIRRPHVHSPCEAMVNCYGETAQSVNRQAAATAMEDKTMNPVVHFEMPYDDRQRMSQFYASAFGWQTQLLDEDMGHCLLSPTPHPDAQGQKNPGAITGGFSPRRPDGPAHPPSSVMAVDDLTAAVRSVTEAGGKVRGEPLEIPGVGQYVSFTD